MYSFDNQYLYHYTTFESAVKIITSKTMLFSKIERLNDINESSGYKILFSDINGQKEEVKRYEDLHKNLKQISFTTDEVDKKGFAIPAMWGHYASRGSGVCLVFDRVKFQSIFKPPIYYCNEVEYKKYKDLSAICYDKEKYSNIDDFVRRNKDDIFFVKTQDWKYEQEFRLIAINSELNSIDISNVLVGVILYNRNHEKFINSVEYKALSTIEKDLFFLRYTTTDDNGYNLYDVYGNSVVPKREESFDFSEIIK